MKQAQCIRSLAISLVVLSALLFTSYSSDAQKTDYSGTWTLDEGRSDLTGFEFRIASEKIVITQSKKEMTMIRTRNGQNGRMEFTDKLTLDGKESVNPAFMDNKKYSTCTWADKKTLTITSKIDFVDQNGGYNTINIIENLSLGDGRKTFTIDYASSSNFGDFKQRHVYNKM